MRALAIAVLVLLCGCQRQPSFDERYKAAQDHISKTAKEIDAQVAASEAAMDQPTDAVVSPVRKDR